MSYVKDKDVKAATMLPEVDSDEEDILSDDWDAIQTLYYIVFFILRVSFDVKPCFDPIQVGGYTQPLTRTYQNPYPGVQVRVLTGTGMGYPEKPQGSL